MKVNVLDSSALPIVEYRHVHDATISLRKYRENFNFGLITNQYYFNQNPKDKKTNFNTQYTLTDLQALSTIAELNIPFTTNAVSAFTTTIKHGDEYLKNNYTDLNEIQSAFVKSSQFNTLSSEFFFTFHVSSVSANNALNKRDTIFISQEYDSKTYYLSAPNDQNIIAKWTDIEPSYFNYTLEDNKLIILNPKGTTSTPGPSANVLINTETSLLTLNNGNFSSTASGTFADATQWSIGNDGSYNYLAEDPGGGGGLTEAYTGWDWSNGYAVHTVNPANTFLSADNIYQDISTVLDRLYEITFTISNYSAGEIRVFLGTLDPTPPYYKDGLTGNGIHTVLVDSDLSNPDRIYIQATANFVGQIDNISIVGTSLFWKAPGAWQNTVSDLSASFFDATRNLLTKDFKTLPGTYNKYKSDPNVDNVSLTNVTSVSNNYFVFTNNYNFFQNNNQNKFISHVDFFPLKNQATLHEYYSESNHYNYEADTNNRVYEKINAGVHQQHGYDKIGLSYNIGTYDIRFKANKLTYFTTPNSMSPYTVLNINDSKIQNLGAIPGSNPLMSDKVFKRREIVKSNTFSDDVNPLYLCSWLSGNSDGDTRWVDRYYNPLASDFSQALSGTSHYRVITAAGAETTETFDVSSSLTFEPNNDYGYYHVGDHDYEKLFEAFDSTYNTTINTEYLNFKGVPTLKTYSKKDREIILDGNTFARNKTDVQGDFSINFWLHTKDNTEPFCYKLLGNYFEDGIGVFNTDLVTPNIILPVNNTTNKTGISRTRFSKLMFLNNDFEVYDYVILKEGEQEVNIDGIARKDNFSEFYVLAHTIENTQSELDPIITCHERKKYIIYIFNNNNHLIGKIEDLKDQDIEIDDFEVDEDRLYVLFAPVDTFNYFTYNTKTNKVGPVINSADASNKPWQPSTWDRPSGSERQITEYYTKSDFDADLIPEKKSIGDIKSQYAACEFKQRKSVPGAKGKLISKDNVVYQFKVDKNGNGNEVTLDSNNVPWVIQQDDSPALTNQRNHVQKLTKRTTTDYRDTGTDKTNRILSGLDRRSKINSIISDDKDNIIVLHDENILSILDNNRKLLRTREYCSLKWTVGATYIDLIYDFERGKYKKYILLIQEFEGGARLSKLDPETLRIVYSKRLDGVNIGSLKLTKTVTSYGYLKKIGANKNRLKVILKKTPKFSSSGKHYKTKSIIDFDFSTLNPGYNHFFINVSLTNGFMCLFVNGKLVEKVTFSGGKYALTNILETGLYVGAVSTPFYITLANKLLQDKKYFVHNAKIKGFKIYNKTMNYFDILAHYNYHVGDKDVVWAYPLGQRTYIDTIDKLFKFNYPEKLANKYKVDIQHTDISDEKLQEKIKDRLCLELQKITPYFDNITNDDGSKNIIIS